jgi:hypothetical protein
MGYSYILKEMSFDDFFNEKLGIEFIKSCFREGFPGFEAGFSVPMYFFAFDLDLEKRIITNLCNNKTTDGGYGFSVCAPVDLNGLEDNEDETIADFETSEKYAEEFHDVCYELHRKAAAVIETAIEYGVEKEPDPYYSDFGNAVYEKLNLLEGGNLNEGRSKSR